MKKFKIATEVYYDGALKYLEGFEKEKVFIVTDKIMNEIGIVNKVTKIFDNKNIAYKIFDKVKPDPSLEVVTHGLKEYMNYDADCIIAIGGGSVIDASKAIVYFIEKGLKSTDKKPYFIAIPTTSGTGSEVTSYSVITDTSKNMKIVLKSDNMCADLAILDCEFTTTVPPQVTADTGMDVLTHAIEAFVSNEASDFTDMLARNSIEIIFKYLEKVYRNGVDKDGREKMHTASCMAGMAFENSALGITHSLAHILGAKFKISHGRANAVILPYVIKYNSGLFDENDIIDFKAAKKYSQIAKVLGLPQDDFKEGVKMLIKSIKCLNKNLNIPSTIQGLGVDKEEFENGLEEMSNTALADICTSGNPRTPSKEDINKIFKEAYLGR